MFTIRGWSSIGRTGAMLAVGAGIVLALAAVNAGAAARARVLAPPGACVVPDDGAFQTADGGCKDLNTWIVFSDKTNPVHWDEASTYCANLVEGDLMTHGDWILPTKDELLGVASDGAATHLADTYLDGAVHHWSSTRSGAKHWAVSFDPVDAAAYNDASWLSAYCRRYAGPTGLTATSISKTQINLAWTDNSDSEVGFELDRSLDQANWTTINLGANAQSHADTGLSSNTTYYYRVRAVGTANESPNSPIVSAKTKK